MTTAAPTLHAIAAMAQNRVIGYQGGIPWNIPEDLAFFKKTTLGHTLLMGRKTFESIGFPLPGRKTIVLSRQSLSIPNVTVLHSLSDIKTLSDPIIWVCGGSEIYSRLLPYCQTLFLTTVHQTPPGDSFFPPFEDAFTLLSTITSNANFSVCLYRNRRENHFLQK